MNITNTSFTQNEANSGGGAIALDWNNVNKLYMNRCILNNNVAKRGGAIAFNGDKSIAIIRETVFLHNK